METVALADGTGLGVVSSGGRFDENAEEGDQFGSYRLLGVFNCLIPIVRLSW